MTLVSIMESETVELIVFVENKNESITLKVSAENAKRASTGK